MSITPFAIILTLIITINIFGHRKGNNLLKVLLILTLIVLLNIRMGYFVKIGEKSISYSTFLIFLTFVFSVICIKRNISKKVFIKILLLIITFIIGIILFKTLPYEEPVIKHDWTNYVRGYDVTSLINDSDIEYGYYIRTFFIGVILIVLTQKFTYNDIQDILKKIINFSKITIILGYAEFFIKNIFKSNILIDVYIFIFGLEGAQQNWLTKRGLFYSVQGATKEASMFTTAIFYIMILFMLDKENRISNKKWFLLGGVLLLINPTLSSIVYIIILSIIYFINFAEKNSSRNKLLIIVLFILICLTVVFLGIDISKDYLTSNNYIINRINILLEQVKAIVNNGEIKYSSEAIRLSGIYYDLKLLKERPLFGFGLGVLVCNSGIVTLLMGVGIIGCVVWYNFIQYICFKGKNSIKYKMFLFTILILPNIFLNDLETVFNLIIPFIGYAYYYFVKDDNEEGDKSEKRETTNNSCYIDI